MRPLMCRMRRRNSVSTIMWSWVTALNSTAPLQADSAIPVHPGALYEHPDHDNTVDIIAHGSAAETEFFGYIDLGVTTQNLDMTEIQGRVDLWAGMGIDGIFFDDFGYDFETSRTRQNDAVSYVHGLGLTVIANGFRPGDVLGDQVDVVFNPSGTPTELTSADFYLVESFQVREGSVVAETEWQSRLAELEPFRNPGSPGIQVMAITTNDVANVYDQDKFNYAWYSALLSGYEALGWGEYNFAAITGNAPFRDRPAVDPGVAFLTAVDNSSPIYTRESSLGRIVVDALTPRAGFNVLDFGDAPAAYPTLVGDDGARHFVGGPRLGNVDFESLGLPSADANGDDNDGLDDEDGTLFGAITLVATLAAVNIDLQNRPEGRVDAWLDFDGNGTWEADEKILDNVLATNVPGFQTFNFTINADAVAGETAVRVRVSSAGNLGVTGLAYDGEVEDYLVTIAVPPLVELVTINGDLGQRSALTEVVVTFDSEVTAPASAFEIKQRVTNTVLDTLLVNSSVVGGKTVAVLTFGSGGNLVIDRANGGNSLVDGNYELTIDAAQIAKVGGGPNMAADYTLGAAAADNFFRFFADQDGDRDTDASDLPAFGATFRKNSGDAGFDPLFDFEGDNDVDTGDLIQFGQRFRQSLPFS